MKTLQQVFDKINRADVFFGQRVESVATERSSGETPLHVAAIWGDADAIETLVRHGADINKRGEDGFTPLHYAAEQNHLGAVQRLVVRGAASVRNDDGDTPAELAKTLGREEIHAYLHQHF